jgi:hypothetical protein
VQPSDSSILSLKIPVLELTTPSEPIASFRPLLEQGFLIQIEDHQTVQHTLCRQLGVAEKYLRDRVQTVFLNGKAVDDETTAVVRDGDRLALSASMPGLVGATMRKGGFFSGLRAAISHRESSETAASKSNAVITIKLFNMIATEIGGVFLRKGILLKGDQFQAWWGGVEDDLRGQIGSAAIDGQALEIDQIKSNIGQTPFLQLRVLSR